MAIPPIDPLPSSPPSAADPDDRALLAAFRDQGDREALQRLLQRHVDAAYRLALRLAGNAADAEDAVQEGCIALIASVRSYRGQGTVRAWLLSIVANTQRHQARSRMRRSRHEREAAAQPRDSGHAATTDGPARAAALACLAELPDRYRLPVAMRFLDGLDFSDISAALGTKEKTLRSQVDRGLERLRGLLAERGVVVGSVALPGLFAVPPASAPPALQAGLQQIAASAPLPAAASGLPAAVWFAATLGLGGLATTVVLFGSGTPPVPPAAPPPAVAPAAPDAPPPAVAVDRVAQMLERRLRFGCHSDTPDRIVARILAQVPMDERVPVACHTWQGRITTAEPWIEVPFADYRVRDILALVALHCGLTMQADRTGVVLFRQVPKARQQALIQAWLTAEGAGLAAAADALAQSGDLACLRPLLLALTGEAGRAQAAAKTLNQISAMTLGGEIDLPPESLLLGCVGDADCRAAVLSALGRTDLPAETMEVVARVAGHLRVREAAGLLLPMAQTYARASREAFVGRGADRARGLGEQAAGRGAIEALGFLGAESAPALAALLALDAGQSNDVICIALGRQRAAAAVQPLLELHRQLQASTDPRVMGYTRNHLRALAWIGDDAAVPTLVRVALGRDRPNLAPEFASLFDRRGDAVTALGVMGTPAAIAGLVQVAAAPLQDVRGLDPGRRAEEDLFRTALDNALRLARRPGRRAEQAPALDAIADPRQRQAIAVQLTDDAEDGLIHALHLALQQERDPPGYRRHVRRFAELGRLEGEAMLFTTVPDMQERALWSEHVAALAQCSTPAATHWLFARLAEDPPLWARRVVATSLIHDRDPSLCHRLAPLIAGESDPETSRALQAALATAQRIHQPHLP